MPDAPVVVKDVATPKPCVHCRERLGGAEGTVWCAACLEWWREQCGLSEDMLRRGYK